MKLDSVTALYQQASIQKNNKLNPLLPPSVSVQTRASIRERTNGFSLIDKNQGTKFPQASSQGMSNLNGKLNASMVSTRHGNGFTPLERFEKITG